ncbi:MAG: TonB-dependent receptor [Acidobacteriia bacterium]|nr:TonB-dependent receptor [Terriglobia bacterium]
MSRIYWLLILTAAAAGQTPRKEVVVVTGTYEPIPLEEADRSVRQLMVNEEQRLVSNTLVDLLNLDSSVDLRQRGQNNMQTDVSIRGGTFGQTLVLLNGMRLNDVQSGHHSMDVPVPLETMERIEVLKGSGSTHYGSDAIGGVVHFITKPPEIAEFRLRGALGNFGVNQERAVATMVRSMWSQQFAFSRDFSTGFIPNRDYRNMSVSSSTSLRTALGNTSILLALSDKPFGAEQFYGNFNSWERTKTWFASGTQSIGERTNIGFAFRRHTDLFVLYRDRPQVFTNRHAAESYQANFRRTEPLGQNVKLHWGVEGLHDSIESNNLGSHSRGRGAGYAALDVRALQRFSFSVGAREEVYGSAESQFSPTVAGGFWISPQLKLRASISRAFRLPTFTDLYYHDPANVGSPDLKPESATSYEFGLDWNSGGRFKVDAAVFQRREKNGIDYVRRSPTDIWRATNFQSLQFTGVEAALHARLRRTHLVDFRYTWLHGAQDQLDGIMSKYSFNYPRHLGIAGWQSVLPAGLLGRVKVGAVQRFGRDPYAVVDAYVARAKGRIHPFLQLTNLTDASYQEIFGVAMPGFGIVGGVEILVFQGKK